jgi:hypothetical protein
VAPFHPPVTAAGGLGGGGDVGLALALLDAAGVGFEEAVIASFMKCNVNSDRLGDLALGGSLIRIPTGYFPSRRVFEDKIPLVESSLEGRVYGLCVKHDWRTLVRGVEELVKRLPVRSMLSADIGGDGLVLGYESSLGSYAVDTVARALLAYASRELGVPAAVATAAVGAEGGGRELDHGWLAATLLYLDSLGAVKASIQLSPRNLAVARRLLKHAESGMLPMLIAAVEGATRARICMAYLCGEYEIMPWYRVVFILDPVALCEASPLCRVVRGRGWHGVRGGPPKARPPRDLLKALREVEYLGAPRVFEEIAKRRRASPRRLRKLR